MNKIISSIALALIACSTAAAQSYSGGDGSVANPYLISSKADMLALSSAISGGNNYSTKHFLLTTNLTGASETITTVIGSNSQFRGTFDGGGHEVAVNINFSAYSGYVALFGYLGANGVIKNLRVSGSVYSSVDQEYVAGICARVANSSISNCYNASTIVSGGYQIGGICGSANSSDISDCYNTGNISLSRLSAGVLCAGGICGDAGQWGSISNCYNTGSISASGPACNIYSGGITGAGGNMTISNCYNTGSVSSSTVSTYSTQGSVRSGGICADVSGPPPAVSNCFVVTNQIIATVDDSQYGPYPSVPPYAGRITGTSSGTRSNCYANSAMLVNGAAVSSNDKTVKNGADALLANFQSSAWCLTNLGWDFADTWMQPSGQLALLKPTFYNDEMFSFTKDCGSDGIGSSVAYYIPEGKYSSKTDTTAANSPAITAGQAYANAQGICSYTITTTAGTGITAPTGGGSIDYGTAANLSCTVSTGYDFDGWYDGATKVSGLQNYTFTVTGTKNLVARGTPHSYSITYHQNGGSGATNATYTIESATITLPTAAPMTKTGYTFGGWYDNSGTTGTAITTIPTGSTGNKAFWANWTPITYTIVLDPRGGNFPGWGVGAIANKTVTYNDIPDFTVNGGLAVKADSIFDGWFTEPNGGGIQYFDNTPYTVTGNTTLYAKWRACVVTFDSQGGSAVPSQWPLGAQITEPTPPTLSCHTFGGWYREASCTNPWNFTTGVVDRDTTLYAEWTLDNYAIIATAGTTGITSPSGGGNKDCGTEADLNCTVSTGYDWDGWYEGVTKVSGSQNYKFTVTAAKTLVARATPHPYTITYHQNGGSGATNDTYTIESAIITLPTAATMTKTGYTFGGWYDNSGTTGTAITAIPTGSTGNKEYWAKWTLITYDITYNLNDDMTFPATNPNPDPLTYNIEDNITLLDPTRGGDYGFSGWYTDAGLTNKVTTVPSIPTGSTGNKTFWAMWTQPPYAIIYHPNGGTTPSTPFEYMPTDPDTPLPGATRDYYDFGGWYAYSNLADTARTVVPSGSTGIKEFWAKWTPINYPITYNLDNGTNHADNPPNYHVESNITLQTPTKTGYDFLGWYDNSGMTGTAITTIPVGSHGDTAFWAKWEQTNYTVTVNYGTGSATGKHYQDTIDYAANDSTGHTFSHWESTGITAPTVASGQFSMPANNVTLTAKYTQNNYSVTVNYGTGSAINKHYQDTIVYVANDSTGYTFSHWESDSITISSPTTASGQFFMPANNVMLTAKYTPNNYSVTVIYGTGSDTGKHYQDPIDYDANDSTGYTFSHWESDSIDASAFSASGQFSMPAKDVTLTACYTIDTLTVSYTANQDFITLSSSSDTVTYGADAVGSEVSLPNNTNQYIYIFDGWYDAGTGTLESTDLIYAPANVTRTMRLEARAAWQLTRHPVNATGAGWGSVSPAAVDTLEYGGPYTISTYFGTIPDPNYHFLKWTLQGSDSAITEFRVHSTVNLVAHFAILGIYTVTANAEVGGQLSRSTDTVQHGGNSQPFAFEANEGYFVDDILVNGESCPDSIAGDSLSGSYTFVAMQSNGRLLVKYKAIAYPITYDLNGGTNHPDNPAEYTIASGYIGLKAPTRVGYTFVGWVEGDSLAAGITGSQTFTAQWEENIPTNLLIFDDVIAMRYDCLLFVKGNNDYNFVDCEWFQRLDEDAEDVGDDGDDDDDGWVSIGTGLIYSAGPDHRADRLEDKADYRATLITAANDTFYTTVGRVKLVTTPTAAPSKMKVYPNPVPQGNFLIIESIPAEVEILKLYDSTNGRWVRSYPVESATSQKLPMPTEKGIYLLQIGRETLKIVVE